ISQLTCTRGPCDNPLYKRPCSSARWNRRFPATPICARSTEVGCCSAVPLTGVTLIRASVTTGGGYIRKSDRPERVSRPMIVVAPPPQRSHAGGAGDQRGIRDGVTRL